MPFFSGGEGPLRGGVGALRGHCAVLDRGSFPFVARVFFGYKEGHSLAWQGSAKVDLHRSFNVVFSGGEKGVYYDTPPSVPCAMCQLVDVRVIQWC